MGMRTRKTQNVYVCTQPVSCVQLFAAPWTIASQDPQSMGFSRQEYWSWLSFPSPGDLPYPGIKPTSLASSALTFFTTSTTREVQDVYIQLLTWYFH